MSWSRRQLTVRYALNAVGTVGMHAYRPTVAKYLSTKYAWRQERDLPFENVFLCPERLMSTSVSNDVRNAVHRGVFGAPILAAALPTWAERNP